MIKPPQIAQLTRSQDDRSLVGSLPAKTNRVAHILHLAVAIGGGLAALLRRHQAPIDWSTVDARILHWDFGERQRTETNNRREGKQDPGCRH